MAEPCNTDADAQDAQERRKLATANSSLASIRVTNFFARAWLSRGQPCKISLSFTLITNLQTCSQVLTVRVQVQVRDSMSQPVFLVISKNFQL